MSKNAMEIAVNLQKKYNKMNEIYDLTKQMQESLYRDDLYSLKLIVRMRTKAMIEIDHIENERLELIEELPEDEKGSILQSMSEEAVHEKLNTPELKKINEIYMQFRRILEKTIELDKVVNLKANKGNSSYAY